MTNPDFKRNTWTVTAGLIMAVLILAFACAAPEIMIKRMTNAIGPLLEEAKAAVYAEDYETASERCGIILDTIKAKSESLKLFFDHKAISELYSAALSAAAIAPAEDPAQLLEELCSEEAILDYLLQVNKAGIKGVF